VKYFPHGDLLPLEKAIWPFVYPLCRQMQIKSVVVLAGLAPVLPRKKETPPAKVGLLINRMTRLSL
jgi:hypothetical protein